MSSFASEMANIRIVIIELLYDSYKAYELPDIAARLALDRGSEEEAFSSKRVFLRKRLNGLNAEGLRNVARILLEEFDHPALLQFVGNGSPSDEGISDTLQSFDQATIHRRWEKALSRRSSDPEGAITLSRTLLEDVFKWILHEQDIQSGERDDLPTLYRKVAKSLSLAPDDHTEEAFKRILGSCQSVVESIATLRNRIGDAHGAKPRQVKPKARHAELTVNLAGAMATFIVSTWLEKNQG